MIVAHWASRPKPIDDAPHMCHHPAMADPDEYSHYLTILYSVLEKPIGLVIATPEPVKVLHAFQRARAMDSAFAEIKIEYSRTNPNGEVWITNGKS